MSEQTPQEHFDLARFVLGYLAEKGSIVAPASFGVSEVLLPEVLAERLKIESYLNLRFDAEDSAPGQDDSLRLSVNHPLVDRLAGELLQAEANSQVFINHLRLDKKGLLEQAEKNIGIANARLGQKKGAMEQQALHHYLRFNFKVTFVSDEKQESLASVVMDAQSGNAVTDSQHLQRLYSTDTSPGYPHMSVAPARWLGAGEIDLPQSYQALLQRAQKALESQLSDRMQAMQKRIQRFLELDQARIEEYYDALEADLRRRMERAEASESGRGSKGNPKKLAAVQGERTAKLSDIHARYQLRLEVELVNVQRIVQPKVILPVEIGDRRLTVTRYVVWDPLRHELEALVCDVCGQPGENLHLCTGGHLAHAECLAPQCIDCKREYCQLCAEQVQTCAVCGEPVCRPSLITCPECKRGTCREHQGLCHAAEGQPALLTPTQPEAAPATAAPATAAPPPTSTTPKAPPAKTGKSSAQTAKGSRSVKSTASSKKSQPIRPGQKPQEPKTTAKQVHVLISATEPAIVVLAMRTGNRPYATRTIELQPYGISIQCECEKEKCPADGWIFRPAAAEYLAEQIESFVGRVSTEYNFPANKVEYYMLYALDRRPLRGFTLPPVWLDEVRLEIARQGFDAEK